jgi:hypothetical protein
MKHHRATASRCGLTPQDTEDVAAESMDKPLLKIQRVTPHARLGCAAQAFDEIGR